MKVIYSQKHYEWLITAGIWPTPRGKPPMPRHQMIGSVIVEDETVKVVQWHENRLYREFHKGKWRMMPATIYSHFHDNLEVVK